MKPKQTIISLETVNARRKMQWKDHGRAGGYESWVAILKWVVRMSLIKRVMFNKRL